MASALNPLRAQPVPTAEAQQPAEHEQQMDRSHALRTLAQGDEREQPEADGGQHEDDGFGCRPQWLGLGGIPAGRL
jgi:hypothetical protein